MFAVPRDHGVGVHASAALARELGRVSLGAGDKAFETVGAPQGVLKVWEVKGKVVTEAGAAIVTACFCLTGHTAVPSVSDSPTPPLCLATAWVHLHAPCLRLPVDPFERVGARL